jgi:hypothetical protein
MPPVEAPLHAAGASPVAPAAADVPVTVEPDFAMEGARARPRRRTRIAALLLGGLLFGSVPRSAPSVWQPDRGFTPEALSGSPTDQRSFGMPFRAVTVTGGATVESVGIEPLALAGDAALGAFVLAVLTQWWQRRRRRVTER